MRVNAREDSLFCFCGGVDSDLFGLWIVRWGFDAKCNDLVLVRWLRNGEVLEGKENGQEI